MITHDKFYRAPDVQSSTNVNRSKEMQYFECTFMSKTASQTASGHLGAFGGFSGTSKCCMDGNVNRYATFSRMHAWIGIKISRITVGVILHNFFCGATMRHMAHLVFVFFK